MGRVVTPKYRLELVVPGFNFTAFAWSGLPSPARLAAHVRQLNQSFDLGGVNHCPAHRASLAPYSSGSRTSAR
jgi:hypothetical protein